MAKYSVMAMFIHPHKDCTGEFIDNLIYDDAMKILKEWQNDKIHKDANICKMPSLTENEV